MQQQKLKSLSLLIGVLCCWNGNAGPRPMQLDEVALSTPAKHYEQHLLGDQFCKQLYQLARDVQYVMDLYKIEFYFSSGTLLGAVRHQGVIPWDDDLDLCLLAQYDDLFKEKAIPKLQALGWKVKEHERRWRGYKIKAQHKTDGVRSPFCDVFIVIESKGVCRYDGSWPWMVLRSDQVRPIGKLWFGDIQISVPHDYQDFLVQNFGLKWREEAVKYNHSNLKKSRRYRYQPGKMLFNRAGPQRSGALKVEKCTGPFLPAGPFSESN